MPRLIVRALILLLFFPACQRQVKTQPVDNPAIMETSAGDTEMIAEAPAATADKAETLSVGAARFDQYLQKLKGKNVGMIVNHSSLVGKTHLVDTLLSQGIKIKKIFAPEHGFRGTADAGETVSNNVDIRTNIPIISLYGDNKKPTPAHLAGLDIVVFDIQDVGARFYTYIYTMSLAMEACAEAGLAFLVLDRPNPNGHYVDGPILDMAHSSFVGMHPIPVVHGMTVAEYAKMVNGVKWLKNGVQCKLDVVTCTGYDHHTYYAPPVKPSPNLPDIKSILLYPSTCFFEGTSLSIGRGTDRPFQLFGAPEYKGIYSFSFTPKSLPGAKNPPLLGKTCFGKDLGDMSLEQLRSTRLNLGWVIEMYKAHPDKGQFFTDFFTKLAGSPELAQQIRAGLSEDEIRATWEPGLSEFKKMRKKYLLYPE